MKRHFIGYCTLFVLLIAATMAQRYSPFVSREQISFHNSNYDLPENSRHLVFLLQYLGNDYARAVRDGLVIDSLEYAEMQNFSRTLTESYSASSQSNKRTLAGLTQLEKHIAAKVELPVIRNLCAQLVGQVAQEKNLLIFPTTTPDLNMGAQLFRENCVSCHGERGAGNGPAADTLHPKPRDLSAPAYLDFVTPFHIYQALTLGISGTAMPAFGEAFSSEQSWSVAFYVMTLRRGFAPQSPRFDINFSLQQLAVQTNIELQRSLSRDAQASKLSTQQVVNTIDYYRSRLPQLSLTEHVMIAKTKWRQSLVCYQNGDSTQALAHLVDGYMEGFEPIEAFLANKVYLRVERLVTEYRWCVEEKGSFDKAAAFIEEMIAILEEILRNPRMLRA
ncbi:c-type cytochrome [candidate division KSB1 bacterium]|nr:c-type cytochrome [candidate division KSB1 bacterium]